MTALEQLTLDLSELAEHDRRQVAELVRLLRLRARLRTLGAHRDDQLTEAYAEFAAEDAELADAGLADYRDGLRGEDQ